MTTKFNLDYSYHILLAQERIRDAKMCELWQDKKYTEMLDRCQQAAEEIKQAAIMIAAQALRESQLFIDLNKGLAKENVKNNVNPSEHSRVEQLGEDKKGTT